MSPGQPRELVVTERNRRDVLGVQCIDASHTNSPLTEH